MTAKDNRYVLIPAGKVKLEGDLFLPPEVSSLIIFSHGSGSTRMSPRNQMVAKYLQRRGFGTLLFDLLTAEEDREYSTRFDIRLLTSRLIRTTEWLLKQPFSSDCNLGYFGASTGAASALSAAAELPGIGAVVSRGGRPDLAMEVLNKVVSPTLLIVGGLDYGVIELNEEAFANLDCEKKLEIVPGATHLFEESGAMEKVCELAAGWFEKYLQPVKII